MFKFESLQPRYQQQLIEDAKTYTEKPTEVSDASGGSSVAAAVFQVPEPKTRGQKRKSQEAEEHHEQWWLRGVTKTDDELPEVIVGQKC